MVARDCCPASPPVDVPAICPAIAASYRLTDGDESASLERFTRHRGHSAVRRGRADSFDGRIGEGLVDDLDSLGVQVRFDGLERIPDTDLHDHAWGQVLVDEQSLWEPSPEIVPIDEAHTRYGF